MRLIDNINALYDGDHKTNLPFITNHKGTVSVYEPGNADTKQVDICKNGIDFYLLNSTFYKGQADLTINKSTLLKDSDCDGVIFYEEDGQQYILNVELKSGFSGEEIRSGYKQIYFTLLKLYTLLSICEDFDFSKYRITAYLVCQPVKDENEESQILHNLLEKKTSGEALTITDQVIHNYLIKSDNVVKCKIRDNGLTKSVLKQNLSMEILNQTITYRLFTMPNLGDHQGILILP